MKKPTNAELTKQLVATIKERDAALELADKHIKRASELEDDLQDAREHAKNLIDEINTDRERFAELLYDSTDALRLTARIMSMRVPIGAILSDDLPF